MKSKKRTAKRGNPIVTVTLIAIAVLCAAFIINAFFGKNSNTADQNGLFGITSSDEAAIVFDGEISETYGRYVNGQVYIPYETVSNNISSAFYVETASDELFMTTQDETLIWSAGDETGNLYKDGDTYYISAACVSEYTDVDLKTFENPARAVINSGLMTTYIVTKDTQIRAEATVSSEIIKECKAGEVLYNLGIGGWTAVMTEDGRVGFIDYECIEFQAEGGPGETAPHDYSAAFDRLTIDTKVSMAWNYIGSAEGNVYLDDLMTGITSLNVISPTWFALSDASGGVSSLADADYVNKAKQTYGLSVWALVGDYDGSDSSTGQILSSYENRQKIISSLMDYALTYGLDGFNIDFEKIGDEYGPAYIEFLRELTQQAHKNNLIISVDNYVPGYTEQYRRDDQNKVVDYIIMMGYDEHTAYTQEYGSVASFSYVENGVLETLVEVDSDKLVLGVPFYTRLWTVPFGSDGFETETVFMADQQEYVEQYGIELVWDEEAGQYTGSAEGSEAMYYIWEETAESLEKKLALVGEYNLAGASAWRLGMQSDDIWSVWDAALN